MKTNGSPARPTALVVDDNPMHRAMVAAALREHGLEVMAAKDGFQAIRVLSGGARSLTLLVVDTEMPGVHGWEVIRFARSKAPALPILRLGRLDDQAPGLCYQPLEAIPVLAKPFTAPELRLSLCRTRASTARR